MDQSISRRKISQGGAGIVFIINPYQYTNALA
jgi:hypothetical protein